MQQCRFGGGVGVVLPLVLTVALAAGSELLNESFMRDDLVMRLLSGAVSPR
ncbi:hypothetical protein OH781_40010 [Streptomyces sp. NBC_01550]